MKDDHTKEGKQADAALYALGAMSQIEARTFENARKSDSEIDQEAAEFETLIGFLGLTADEAEPSPYIRDLIINRFEKEQQAKPQKIELPRQETSRSVITPVEETPSRSRSFIPWAVAASFALVALGAVFFWSRSYQDANRLQQQLALAESEKRQLIAQVERQGQSQEDIQRIQATISSPELKLIELGGQEVAPQSSARVLWDVSNRRWAVVVNLPPAPPGKVYQLWLVTKDAKISAGLLKTDRSGHGITLVTVPSNVNQFDATAITLEPDGGSEQPTSQIYALGKSSI